MEQLESDPNYIDYHEPKVPLFFSFIYTCFLEIFSNVHEVMTWTDIYNYSKLRKIDFTQYELDVIIKCGIWAENKKSEMRDNEE